MRLTFLSLLAGAAIVPLGAQSVLSVHSGVVHYVDGEAFIGDKAVELKFGQFPNIPEGQNFRTEAGRAEILLTPGSFLRLAENSEIKMVSTHLSDTRIELLKGEIAVESVDSSKDAGSMIKGNSIAIIYQGTTTNLLKAGLYQFTADPARVKVYEGEASIKAGGDELLLKKGKETGLNSALLAEKFDPKVGDELIRWSSRRSGYLAMANVNAARTLSNDTSQWNGYLGSGYGAGGWAFNSLYGMYSFVPYGGIGFDPFGYSFYSPYSVFYSPFGYGFPYGYGYGLGGYGYPVYYGGGGGTTAGSGPIYSRSPFHSGGIGGGVRSPILTRPTGAAASTFRTASSSAGRSFVGGGFSGGSSRTTGLSSLSTTSSRGSSGGFSGGGGGGHSGGGGGHH